MIWATGYRADYAWIDLPVLDVGLPRHRRDATEIPGLYFLGLSWQHMRGSALIGSVGDDAEFIAGEMEAAAIAVTAGTKPANENDEGALTPQAAGAMEGV